MCWPNERRELFRFSARLAGVMFCAFALILLNLSPFRPELWDTAKKVGFLTFSLYMITSVILGSWPKQHRRGVVGVLRWLLLLIYAVAIGLTLTSFFGPLGPPDLLLGPIYFLTLVLAFWRLMLLLTPRSASQT